MSEMNAFYIVVIKIQYDFRFLLNWVEYVFAKQIIIEGIKIVALMPNDLPVYKYDSQNNYLLMKILLQIPSPSSKVLLIFIVSMSHTI